MLDCGIKQKNVCELECEVCRMSAITRDCINCKNYKKENNMKIKIKKWEELDVKNEKYIARWFNFSNVIRILTVEEQCLTYIDKNFPDEIIIGFLKLLGFDVELEQPHKLTWREWCFCNAYPGYCIARNKYEQILVFERKPERFDGYWNSTKNAYYLPEDTFKMVTWDDEPISTNEMLKWEHDPEPKCTFDE